MAYWRPLARRGGRARFKAHAWRACKLGRVSGVQIPPSPPTSPTSAGFSCTFSEIVPTAQVSLALKDSRELAIEASWGRFAEFLSDANRSRPFASKRPNDSFAGRAKSKGYMACFIRQSTLPDQPHQI